MDPRSGIAILIAALSVISPTARAAAPVPQPATWMEHVLVVNLQQLPKAYTCDELW